MDLTLGRERVSNRFYVSKPSYDTTGLHPSSGTTTTLTTYYIGMCEGKVPSLGWRFLIGFPRNGFVFYCIQVLIFLGFTVVTP